MTLNIRDPQLLGNLSPQEIASHLQQQGWESHHTIANGLAQIWRLNHDNQTQEILLPLDPKLDDFALRIADILTTLAEVENRTKEDILATIATTIPDLQIQGLVTRLQENADFGKVTIMGVIAGRLHRIQMALPEPTYDLAIKAYQARLPILCKGDLHRNPTGFILQPVQQFTVDLDIWIAKSA
jgi:hypothetical protein